MATIDEREYWTTREARMREEMAMDAELAQRPEAKLHRLEVRYSATPDTMHAARAAIAEQIEQVKAEIDSREVKPEWTLEETTANRIEWNNRVRKGQNPLEILKATGIRFATLKAMIAHYGL